MKAFKVLGIPDANSNLLRFWLHDGHHGYGIGMTFASDAELAGALRVVQALEDEMIPLPSHRCEECGFEPVQDDGYQHADGCTVGDADAPQTTGHKFYDMWCEAEKEGVHELPWRGLLPWQRRAWEKLAVSALQMWLGAPE